MRSAVNAVVCCLVLGTLPGGGMAAAPGSLEHRKPGAASLRSTPDGTGPATQLSSSWKRLDSPNFAVLGNASDSQLRNTAAELEAFRALLVANFPSLRLSSPVPTRVVVLKDRASFAPFAPRDSGGGPRNTIAGYFLALPDVNYILVSGERGDVRLDVVLHEYVHYVLERNLVVVPPWLGEGLAEFYSTFQPAREEDRSLVGTAPPWRVELLRSRGLIPLERLLSTEGAVGALGNPREVGVFYAESWALVHFLCLGEGGGRAGQVSDYVRALQDGLTLEQAFVRSFRCTLGEMESRLRRYLRSLKLPALSVPRPPMPMDRDAEPRPMLEADAEALRADVLRRIGAPDEAEQAAARALALDPGHARARLALAGVRIQQQKRDDGISLLLSLPAAGPEAFGAQLMLASALIEAGRYREAAAAAGRAVALNADSPAAWFTLSIARLLGGRRDLADEATRRLLEIDPRPDYFRRRAYEAFRLGDAGAAASDAMSFLERAGWGNEFAPDVAFLAAVADRRLGREDEADVLLDRARSAVRSLSWKARLLDFLQRRLPAVSLLLLAREAGQKTQAHAYVGFDLAGAGRPRQAIPHLEWVRDHGSRNYVEHRLAVAELRRLASATDGGSR